MMANVVTLHSSLGNGEASSSSGVGSRSGSVSDCPLLRGLALKGGILGRLVRLSRDTSDGKSESEDRSGTG